MRVISGEAKGSKLKCLEGLDTRPTADRVKEAVFSMISMHIAKSRVLDLFAGTGALGIEALSRGAGEAVFVDNSSHAIQICEDNLIKTKQKDKAKVYNRDSIAFLKQQDVKFDIIFLDPPYKSGIYQEVLNLILKCDLLNDDALVVIECEKGIPLFCEGYVVEKEKCYGKTCVFVLKKDINKS